MFLEFYYKCLFGVSAVSLGCLFDVLGISGVASSSLNSLLHSALYGGNANTQTEEM